MSRSPAGIFFPSPAPPPRVTSAADPRIEIEAGLDHPQAAPDTIRTQGEHASGGIGELLPPQGDGAVATRSRGPARRAEDTVAKVVSTLHRYPPERAALPASALGFLHARHLRSQSGLRALVGVLLVTPCELLELCAPTDNSCILPGRNLFYGVSMTTHMQFTLGLALIRV